MKHLRKFSNLAAKEAAIIHRPCVSLIEDTMDIVYDPYLPPFVFNPRYLYTDCTTSTELDSSKTVMGVEVIPASHMPDGKARFVSVKNMSHFAGEVETGTVTLGDSDGNGAFGITWGSLGIVAGLTCYTDVGYDLYRSDDLVTDDNPCGLQNKLSEEPAPWAYVVSDYDNGIEGNSYPFFSNAYLPLSHTPFGTFGDHPLPYPFNYDGTKNALYWNNGVGMAITDMDGNANTAVLLSRLAPSITWSEGDALNITVSSNEGGIENYPAAVACRRFHGGNPTTAGRWYLPSAGELGYLMANIVKINAKIDALPSGQGVKIAIQYTPTQEGARVSLGTSLLSSTQYDENRAWALSTYGKNMDATTDGIKFFSSCSRVRAFLAV